MPSEVRSPRLAVLIDADNVSAKIADGLFEEIAKIGEASVRRIYGDFSNPRSRAWADTLSKHAIIPQQQFAYTTGTTHPSRRGPGRASEGATANQSLWRAGGGQTQIAASGFEEQTCP